MNGIVTKRRLYPILGLMILALVSLACGSSTTERLAEAARPTEVSSAAVIDTPQAEAPDLVQEEVQQTAPAVQPAPAIEPVVVLAQGFGQDERRIGYAFIVENPNTGSAIESSQYQIAAYNLDGTVVDTSSGYITLVRPGERLGIGGDMFVNENVTVARIEAQVKTGKGVTTDPIPSFSMESVAYRVGTFRARAVGVVHNPFNLHMSNLRVSVVAYDATDNIIGGGYTFQNFTLANSSSGVEVSLTSSGNVARLEMYPTLSGLSALTMRNDKPDDAANLLIVRHGYGQSENRAGFGFVVQNPNPAYSVESSQYHVTAFSGDGQVLSVEEGYINTLLPNQMLGIADDILLDDHTSIVRLDVQIMSGKYVASETLPTFSTENVAYQAESYSSKVTGIIVNPYGKDITNLKVAAILYNEAGEIVGGGYTFLNFVPAYGRSAVEVRVTSAVRPATVELHATVSSLSDID